LRKSIARSVTPDSIYSFISSQKARPKSAAAPKAKKEKTNTTTEKGNRRGNRAAGARGRNPGRGKPKTVEELDAEMVDYFSTDAPPADNAAATNGAVPQVNAAQDVGMNDEIL
jgi:THO complex subunit 4